MENKINVVVAERSYTLTTADDAEYVEKVAEFVNTQVNQLSEASHASTLDAAIMAALNIADGYFKAQETAENLRKQVKQYLDEATRIRWNCPSPSGSCSACNSSRAKRNGFSDAPRSPHWGPG